MLRSRPAWTVKTGEVIHHPDPREVGWHNTDFLTGDIAIAFEPLDDRAYMAEPDLLIDPLTPLLIEVHP